MPLSAVSLLAALVAAQPASAALAASAPAPSAPAPSAPVASAPEQVPGVFRMRLGDFTVTALSDGTVAQDLHEVMTGTTRSQIDGLLRRAFLANPVEASINAYLIDTGTRLILVDTGAGLLFGAGSGGRLIASLLAAGYRPERIDDILITHVHTDHSGGLTDGSRMLFPRATVHAGQADLDFFLNPANARTPGVERRLFDEAQATVGPYARAGRVRGFSGRTRLFPGVVAIPTPGHTPGHAFYRVESRGESIEFWGDVMHFGAVQFPRPAVTVRYDVNSPAAAAQRIKQFAAAARDRRRVAVAHVNFPGIGNIRAESDGGYVWVPVEYRDPGAGRRAAPTPGQTR